MAMELKSPTLPAGKILKMDLTDKAVIAQSKEHPFTIKEGIEYKCVFWDKRQYDPTHILRFSA
jgi:hypothetical protein